MTNQSQSQKQKPRQPAAAPRGPSLGSVLRRVAQGGNAANGKGAEPQAADIDWDRVNSDLEQKVRFATSMQAMKMAGDSDEKPDMGGMASLITALSTALKGNGDSTSAMVDLMKYIQERDSGALREEIAELKAGMAGGGNPVLETLTALGQLGLLDKNGSQDGTVNTLQTLSTLGIIRPQQEQSPLSMVDTLLSIVDRLRPAAPAPPSPQYSPIQMGDGQAMSMEHFLAIMGFQERKEKQEQETALQRERIGAVREGLETLVGAVAEAAQVLSSEEAPAAQRKREKVRRQGRRELPPYVDVPCDYCEEKMRLTAEDLSKQPQQVECSACGEVNQLMYKEENDGEGA